MDPNPTNWWPPPLRANGRTADGRTDSSSFPFPFLKISLSPVRCSGRLPPRVLSVGPTHTCMKKELLVRPSARLPVSDWTVSEPRVRATYWHSMRARSSQKKLFFSPFAQRCSSNSHCGCYDDDGDGDDGMVSMFYLLSGTVGRLAA